MPPLSLRKSATNKIIFLPFHYFYLPPFDIVLPSQALCKLYHSVHIILQFAFVIQPLPTLIY